jgi:predicted MFS family arabinose efflux permease
VPVLVIGLLLESGFTPVALAYLADISETRVEHRGAVMGLYSVFLGIGQFIGGASGGLFIVGLGFNGLLLFSLILGGFAAGTVVFLRRQHAI